jgi:hypothetical protein
MFGRKDASIMRYLDGLMSPSEKEEFLRHLENDAALRNTVKLEQDIRNAMQSEARDIPASHAAARARAMAAVASTPASRSGNGKNGKMRPPGAKGGASAGGLLAIGLILKIILGVVVAAGIVAGAILLTREQNADQTPTPRVERRAAQPPQSLSPPAAPERANPKASASEAEADSRIVADPQQARNESRRVTPAPRSATSPSRAKRAASITSSSPSSATKPQAHASETSQQQTSAPPVFKSTRAHAPVVFGKPKQ